MRAIVLKKFGGLDSVFGTTGVARCPTFRCRK